VTGHFAIVAAGFGSIPETVTLRRNGWSRSTETSGHDAGIIGHDAVTAM
jgi:hypothetical protein